MTRLPRVYLGLSLVVAAVTLSGCATGANTVRITTIPEGATLTVNGEYKGETPKAVPQKWWYCISHLLFAGADSLDVKLEKHGYRTVEKTIHASDITSKYKRGLYEDGSEFGYGRTFTYSFPLAENKD